MTVDDSIERLTKKLAGMKGSGRRATLLELSNMYLERHWRAGPTSPQARGWLDSAIRVLDEAYGYADPGDALRGEIAGMAGWLYGTRFMVYPGPDHDRKTAVFLLEEALTFPTLPPFISTMGSLTLGQMYVMRVMKDLQSNMFVSAVMHGTPPPAEARTNVERATDLFRRVLSGEGMIVSADVRRMAQASLTMTEAARSMLDVFVAGKDTFDFGRIAETLATLQELQKNRSGLLFGTAGFPGGSALFDGFRIQDVDPLDRPVMVSEGPEPPDEFVPRPRPALTVDAEPLRQSLRAMMAAATGTDDVYAAATALIRGASTVMKVDDFVSVAMSVVHGGDTTTATDHFLLATALYLRSLLDDGNGWDDDGDGSDDDGSESENADILAATASLRTAAATMPVEYPEGMVALLVLATHLPESGIGRNLTDITTALATIGAAALVFPLPDGPLWLDAASGRLTPDGIPADTVVVLGDHPVPGTDDLAVSSVASTAQLISVSKAAPKPMTDHPVFVVNPRGDQGSAPFDVMLIRRTFYPRSTGLGQLVEGSDGAGTSDQVRAHLDASMLHLACGITAGGRLELAGSDELEFIKGATSAGGLVILPPGKFLPIADVLLAAGFSGVIGWSGPVPAPVAALALFLLHTELVDHGRTPVHAVREVNRWLRDPHRVAPAHLPMAYASAMKLTASTNLLLRGR